MDHVIKSASSGKESFEASLKHAYFRSLENDIVKVESKINKYLILIFVKISW